MSFDIDMNAFFKALDFTDERVVNGATRGMQDAVDDLVRESRDLTPLDKRGLRDSAYGTVVMENGSVVGEVSYSVTEKDGSGERFNYALYMHEFGGKTEYENPSTPGTGPKFLERPLKENHDRYMQTIAEEIRKELT